MRVWPAVRPRSGRAITPEGLFEGTIWECDNIGQFMIDEYLPEHLGPDLEFELEDVVADANAIFEDINYDVATTREDRNGITITVKGTYEGYSLDDDVDEPSIIDMEITIYLRRCAGLISFEKPEIFVEGMLRLEEETNDDDDDDESDGDQALLEDEQELAS